MEEDEFEEAVGNTDDFIEDIVPSAGLGLSFEKRIERLNQSDRIDQLYGCLRYTGFEERIGWLYNLQPCELFDDERRRFVSALDLYFIGEIGDRFKISLVYAPYFYVGTKLGRENDVYSYLSKRYHNRCLSCDLISKEDLDLPNHLAGIKRTLIRLRFHDIDDLMKARKELQPIVKRNTEREKEQQSRPELAVLTRATSANSRSSDLIVNGLSNANVAEKQIDGIIELREFDVPYHIRVCIDLKINVGLWYGIRGQSSSGPQNQLILKPELIEQPEPIILAFDIECTKMPLKFPTAVSDQIMMISYMIDTQGYLIINREIISQNIDDFEYTPKKEYPGHFHVFNELNEFELLKRFFNHIIDVKPHILVTYNGDSFDMPFVEQRAQFYGLNMYNEIGFRKDSQDCYLSRPCVHMDCIKWVKRDSYLPVGSHGLKAVTKAKLRYNPIEIDPEDMCRLAVEQPQTLSNYSVSDAVATYYLYMKYVHTFIFALGTIIPMRPDEVLRKGSGTLCETLLMVQAFIANVIYPNKHEDEQYKYTNDGHLLTTETYVGASVEALESGVFRSDIPCRFKIVPETIQYLIDNIDRTLQQSIEIEEKLSIDLIENLSEIKEDIIQRLQHLKNVPNRLENPNIYHLDVGAMYPNIILTNRLQPSAIVNSTICAQCDLNRPNARCQRKMDWIWRGTYVPATRNELQRIQLQLENERFQFNGQAIEKKTFIDGSKKGTNTAHNNTLSFHELPQETQLSIERKRLADYCRKAYKKVNHTREETRETTVCQCENSFYVDTVRAFRDRRYEYKGLHKKWKKNLTNVVKKDDPNEVKRCNNLIVIYDSLQLAHKCILNSFYGYVMRRGARWHRMEMGGIVCTTGSTIIKRTRELIEQIGRPLELDTDGIWCVLPATFPENYELITRDPLRPKVVISYPCSLLNLLIKDFYTNDQYHELIDKEKHQYEIRSENSIFFEIDGPYLAMILPASKEEGKRIKKRYCVFNMDGSIAELKGFEVKRNGELQLIKIFQASVFEAFLKGTTLEECYNHVATIADYWLDMLYSRAKDITDKELFELISERRTMSRMLSDYGEQKSTSISTAKRLAEFLGEDVIKDKGLCCRFVIANVPRDAPITERAIPLAIFQSEQSIRNHYLRKWLRLSSVDNLDIREILDWNYYIDRFNSCIQKIITIPAALQNIRNPVLRVPHPEWLHKRLVEKNSLYKQKRITDVFNTIDKQTHIDNNEQELITTNDIEDIVDGQTKSTIKIGKKITKTLKRKRDELNEKTITRQWRVILGPPPSFGQTNNQHIKWINYQKRKWDIQREQPSINSNNSQIITKQKNATDGKIDTYIRRAAEHLHTRPWQIISYELTDQPGIFKAWCLVEHELVQIKIKVPRIFYVNYRTSIEEQIKQTQRSIGYERAINNCSHKVNRLLPRCSQAYHLYEYRLDENNFRDYYTDIMTDLSNPNIEGVYEMNVPLDFRLLITLGCICSLRKEQYRSNILSNLYQFDELEFLSLSEQTYLQSGTLQCIYLYIHQDNGKLFIGLFIPNNCRVFIGILDSIRENHMPNLNKLLKNECEKRLQKGIDTNLLPINEHQFEVKVDTDLQNIWKRFNKIIANLRENDLATRSLPIYLAIQSNIPVTDLQTSMLSSLIDYPKVILSIKDKVNLYKGLDWQRTAARHALQHYANANIILVNMLEQCRYLHIPLGNFPDDPCLFACDLFYARHLIKHNNLLWCSLTDQPDLGGKEQDDYRMLLTADVNNNQNNQNSNENIFNNDNEEIHSNKQNHPFEINHSGFYPTSCIEFELVGLAICAVLNFQKIHEVEGSNFDLGFGTTIQNPLGGPGVIPSISNTSMTAYDETSQCLPALRLLRQMVQVWLQDVHSYTNIFADMQLNHFYRWLQSTKSLLYEPALKRTIQVFMRKLLVQLLVELQRIGSTTIYGNLNKIILATKRWSLGDTRLYIKVILEHLQLKDLTSTICLELKSIYHCLWWFDDKNYCGFRIWSNTKGQIDDNIDNDDEEETIFDWNMIVYLPRVVQDYFETIMIGFARSIYDRLRDEYKEATSITQTNLPVKVLDYCRGLFTDELYQQLMSVTNQIERKLTKSDFDSTLPTPLSSTSPALEFVKSVCCLLFLLHDMHDDVMNLRRDLLKLLKLSEYSEMTTTNLSSLTSFVVPQLVCSNCNHYRDIDLYREINSTVDKDSDDESNRQYQYTCNQCHTAYDQTVIEQYLLNHLQTLVLENVLQDAICNKCHFVRNVYYKIYCDCGELYQNLHTTRLLNDTCIILSQIASKHQMIALLQQIQFLKRLNHWND